MLIISDELPEGFNERLSFLNLKRCNTPEVGPISWTIKKYQIREDKNDPFIRILKEEGFVIEERL